MTTAYYSINGLAGPLLFSETAPGAPSNVVAVAGVSEADLTWDAPVDDGGVPIERYDVVSIPATTTQTVPVGTLALTFTGLTNGVAYTFKVQAVGPGGAGALSSASNSVTPEGVTMALSGDLMFSASEGGSDPASQDEDVTNSGLGTLDTMDTPTIVYHDVETGWLTLTPGGSGNAQTIGTQPTTGALTHAGSPYTATVTVNVDNADNTPLTYDVTFTVNSPFTPPANTKLQAGDVTDMSNWFLKPGISPVLNATDYNGNPNSANTVTMSAGNSTHQGFTNNTTGAWTTWGMALKVGSGIQYAALFRNDSSADYSVFDLAGGTVVSDHGTSVGTIHDLGGGWYWCSIVLGSSVQTFALVQFADTLPHINPNQNWTAAGTETVIAGPFSVN